MDPPPPYYTTAAALQAEHRDLATTIRQLSNETIKVDDQFQGVYVELKRDEMFDQSSQSPSNEWAGIRKHFTDILWSTRSTAGELKSRTIELVDVILPAIAEPGEDKQAKIADITQFIDKPAPSLLTTERAAEKITELKQLLGSFSEKSTTGLDEKIRVAREEIAKLEEEAQKQRLKQQEAEKASHGLLGFLHSKPPPIESIDYDSKIKRSQESVQGWEKLRNSIVDGIREICTGLDTIPDRIGSAFSALWLHEKNDSEHLRREVESSTDGNVR
ncbi:hypothetical protein BDV93DRAFT_524929, partial [Ceratobasidium sp. AG-I]